MKNNVNKVLKSFIDEPEDEKNEGTKKKEILREREGLIERIDKVYVTDDGRQLLREQY